MFAMVFMCFQTFLQVFQTLLSSVSSVFFYMLQLLYLDVSKVDHGVAHGMHMESGWQHGRRSER
jgi:hypothetical protein